PAQPRDFGGAVEFEPNMAAVAVLDPARTDPGPGAAGPVGFDSDPEDGTVPAGADGPDVARAQPHRHFDCGGSDDLARSEAARFGLTGSQTQESDTDGVGDVRAHADSPLPEIGRAHV